MANPALAAALQVSGGIVGGSGGASQGKAGSATKEGQGEEKKTPLNVQRMAANAE